MQLNINRSVKYIEFADEALVIDIANKIVDQLVETVELGENNAYAKFIEGDAYIAMQDHFPNNIFRSIDLYHDPEVSISTVVANGNMPSYADEAEFIAANAASIANIFWPVGSSWYIPIWHANSHLKRYVSNFTDAVLSKALFDLTIREKAIQIFIDNLNRMLDDLDTKLFITAKTAVRYGFMVALEERLQELAQETNKKYVTGLNTEYVPAFAYSLFAKIFSAETNFCKKNDVNEDLYKQVLMSFQFTNDERRDREIFISSGKSRTNARKLVRIGSETTRDVAKEFLAYAGGYELYYANKDDPEQQTFKSGHGSYLIS